MTNIVKLYTSNKADDALEQAIGVYDDVLILGYDKEGFMDVRANDSLSNERILWLISILKKNLLNGDYDE